MAGAPAGYRTFTAGEVLTADKHTELPSGPGNRCICE